MFALDRLAPCGTNSSCPVSLLILSACIQAALEMDIEDINAYLQHKDAVQLLKRMPKSRMRSTPAPSLATHESDSSQSAEARDFGVGAAA